MSPTELEQRVRYLERMSASVRRSQRRDDEDIEKLTIRPRGGSAPAAPVTLGCDGFCEAPFANLNYETTYDYYSYSTGLYVSSWSGSGTLTYRARDLAFASGGPVRFSPYWYSVPITRTAPSAFYAPTYSPLYTWSQFFFFCRRAGAGTWFAQGAESPYSSVSNPPPGATGFLTLTSPPDTADFANILLGNAGSVSRSCPFDYTFVLDTPQSPFNPWGRYVRTTRIYA